MLIFRKTAPSLLGCVIAHIAMSETTALVMGRRWGKHNFSYFISPKKTWEGFAGQFIGIIVAIVLIKFMMWLTGLNDLGYGTWTIFFMGFLIVPIAILGDLMESILKRSMNVKDSSETNIVGGLGGILDKFDSFGVCWILFPLIVRYTKPELFPL